MLYAPCAVCFQIKKPIKNCSERNRPKIRKAVTASARFSLLFLIASSQIIFLLLTFSVYQMQQKAFTAFSDKPCASDKIQTYPYGTVAAFSFGMSDASAVQ